jgi:multiple sugar transport system ATP-binding protein
MNLVEAGVQRRDEALVISFGSHTLPIEGTHPGLERYVGKTVIAGIRPEDFAQGSGLRADVTLVEALGSEVIVHFTMDAPVVLTEDTRELAGDVGAESVERLERRAREGRADFVARLGPRTAVRTGEPLDLAVDTKRMHFFDPETGVAIKEV